MTNNAVRNYSLTMSECACVIIDDKVIELCAAHYEYLRAALAERDKAIAEAAELLTHSAGTPVNEYIKRHKRWLAKWSNDATR